VPLHPASSAQAVTPAEPPPVPAYLADRFGPHAAIVVLRHDPSWQLGAGALIFEDEDARDPRRAIGVVLRTRDGKTEALVAASAKKLVVRDLGQAIPAEIQS
jgi:sarcosine oxidase subunit alpha